MKQECNVADLKSFTTSKMNAQILIQLVY